MRQASTPALVAHPSYLISGSERRSLVILSCLIKYIEQPSIPPTAPSLIAKPSVTSTKPQIEVYKGGIALTTRETTLTVVRGLGRAFLCLSLSVSVCTNSALGLVEVCWSVVVSNGFIDKVQSTVSTKSKIAHVLFYTNKYDAYEESAFLFGKRPRPRRSSSPTSPSAGTPPASTVRRQVGALAAGHRVEPDRGDGEPQHGHRDHISDQSGLSLTKPSMCAQSDRGILVILSVSIRAQ